AVKAKTKTTNKSPKVATETPVEPVEDIIATAQQINQIQPPPTQKEPEQKDSTLKPQPNTPLSNHGRPPRHNDDDDEDNDEDGDVNEEEEEDEEDDEEKGDTDQYKYEFVKLLQKNERKLLPYEDDEDYIFSPSEEEDEDKLDQQYRREDMMYSKIGRSLQRAIEGKLSCPKISMVQMLLHLFTIHWLAHKLAS
ncbi:MAG: hypothetical protein EZS28_051819, partial [Streblomastix strix]